MRGIRTDLHGRGNYYYFGVPTQHRPLEMYFLDNFLRLNRVDKIIEIGTHYGGLTRFFAMQMYLQHGRNVEHLVTSIDIIDKKPQKLKDFKLYIPMQFFIYDCFAVPIHELIKNMIQQKHRVLLYCDGGDKDREFNTFAPYLKKGDFIMAHDRGTKEIPYVKIKDTVEDLKLIPMYEDVINKLECRIYAYKKG